MQQLHWLLCSLEGPWHGWRRRANGTAILEIWSGTSALQCKVRTDMTF